jgi:hypothetical protein
MSPPSPPPPLLPPPYQPPDTRTCTVRRYRHVGIDYRGTASTSTHFVQLWRCSSVRYSHIFACACVMRLRCRRFHKWRRPHADAAGLHCRDQGAADKEKGFCDTAQATANTRGVRRTATTTHTPHVWTAVGDLAQQTQQTVILN